MSDSELARVRRLMERRAAHARLSVIATTAAAVILGLYSLAGAWLLIEHHEPAFRLLLSTIADGRGAGEVAQAIRLAREIGAIEGSLRITGLLAFASAAWAVLEWRKVSVAQVQRVLWERLENIESRLGHQDHPQ